MINPIVDEAIKELLTPIIVSVVVKVLEKHNADPEFGQKMGDWVKQHEAAKGGTDADRSKASRDLWVLLGS